MKIWVTKWALTRGILDYDSAEVSASDGKVSINMGSYLLHFHKPFWHTTREAAVEHANQLCVRKIAALKKQIKKLSKPIE